MMEKIAFINFTGEFRKQLTLSEAVSMLIKSMLSHYCKPKTILRGFCVDLEFAMKIHEDYASVFQKNWDEIVDEVCSKLSHIGFYRLEYDDAFGEKRIIICLLIKKSNKYVYP